VQFGRKDIAAIRRLVKAGAAGKTIAEEIGRSLVALYQKASIEGISLSRTPTGRRSAVAKKAKAAATLKMRRSR
jgi:hypothetical protein